MNDREWNTAFATEALGKKVISVTQTSLSGEGGNSGEVQRLSFEFEDGEKKSYVLKVDREASRQRSRELGLAREGLFYKEFGTDEMRNTLFPFLPVCRYASGDIKEGSKSILMEDLSTEGVQAGLYFSAHSPLNWQKKAEGKLTEAQLSGKHMPEVTKKMLCCCCEVAGPILGEGE